MGFQTWYAEFSRTVGESCERLAANNGTGEPAVLLAPRGIRSAASMRKTANNHGVSQ